METLDLIFTVIFVVGTSIVMILIYFYNKRHAKPEMSEVDKFQVKTKDGKEIAHEANADYNWDLYESDVRYDYDGYVGYDIWKDEKKASLRIKQLKNIYEFSNDGSINLNMIETMMLISKFGDDIVLEQNGTYKVKKFNLDAFVQELDYDKETISLIAEIKEELDFSISDYSIDAKTIFYLMANAKNLGINNLSNNSQLFLFAKKINNKIIDEVSSKKEKDIVAEISIEIDDNIHEHSSANNSDNVSDSIYTAMKNISNSVKRYEDDNGNNTIEYPNGQKVIRHSMWDFEVIEDDTRSLDEIKEGTKLDIIEADKDNDLDVNPNGNSEKRTDSHRNAKEKENIEENIEEEVTECRDNFFTSVLKTNLEKSFLTNKDGDSLPYIGFLGDISSTSELMNKIEDISSENIQTIIINLLSTHSSFVEYENSEIYFVLSHEGSLYLSYDFLIYCLVVLASNGFDVLKKENFLSKTNTLVYPVEIVDMFIEILLKRNIDIFSMEHKPTFYYKNKDGINISMKTILLEKKGLDLVGNYNSPEKLSFLNIEPMSKKELKKIVEKKCVVNFSNFA